MAWTAVEWGILLLISALDIAASVRVARSDVISPTHKIAWLVFIWWQHATAQLAKPYEAAPKCKTTFCRPSPT
jgi:hypothetical protein